jgi:hypothetical protein
MIGDHHDFNEVNTYHDIALLNQVVPVIRGNLNLTT